jgi:hypothetical protein
MEPEDATEEAVPVEESPVAEEELPEDLFADLEMEPEDATEEAVPVEEPVAAAEEEVPEELFADLESEIAGVAAGAAAPAEIEASEAIAPATAEELAALLSAQVEEVVTRLVGERLPSIVERAIAEEIEKIRANLESGE